MSCQIYHGQFILSSYKKPDSPVIAAIIMFQVISHIPLTRALAIHFKVSFVDVLKTQNWAQVWWVHVKGKRPTLVSKKVVVVDIATPKPTVSQPSTNNSIVTVSKTEIVATTGWQKQDLKFITPDRDAEGNIKFDLTRDRIIMVQEARKNLNGEPVQNWYTIKNGSITKHKNYTNAALDLLGVNSRKIWVFGVTVKQSEYGQFKVAQSLLAIIRYCHENNYNVDVVAKVNEKGFQIDAKTAIESPSLFKVLMNGLRIYPNHATAAA